VTLKVPAPEGPRDVFVTGGTGFIGRRLVNALLARGDRVRVLVRTPSAARDLEAAGVRLVQGEITDEIALAHGVAGVSLSFHLAAVYDVGVVDMGAMERINVDGTTAFLRAVRDGGVARAVYVSTTAALGPASDRAESGAQAEYRGPYPSLYHRTKARAHAIARAAQAGGLPLVIVCPAYVYGPGDRGPGGRFVLDLLRGRVPGLLSEPATFSYVHVDDVVKGLLAASERGRVGETYILSGRPRWRV
jgi:nucleoside-diphosphate-sugar epimerase